MVPSFYHNSPGGPTQKRSLLPPTAGSHQPSQLPLWLLFFLPSDGAELKPCTQSLAKVQLNFKMLWWTRNATRKSFKKSKSQLNQLFFKMEVAKHQVSFWKAKGCNTQDINSRFSRKNLSCYHSIHHVAHHVGSAPSAWYSDPGDLTTEVSCWR